MKSLARFTLIELLTVIFTIALLIGLLLPALNAARKKAHAANCLSNCRQTFLALNSYADDHQEMFPVVHRLENGNFSHLEELEDDPQWFEPLINHYRYKPAYLRCPSDPGFSGTIQSYMFNAIYTVGYKRTTLHNPSRLIILSERGEQNGNAVGHQCYPGFSEPDDVKAVLNTVRHTGTANYLFLDGHSAAHRFEETIGDGSEERNRHFVKQWCGSYQEAHSHSH
jgi:hypothetical protein